MKREDLVAFLTGEIVQRKRESKPLKVGIDGRSAAGKSVLAIELSSAVRKRGFDVFRPSVDGFHHPRERRYQKGEYSPAGYYEDAYDYEAVIDHVLAPLSGNTFPVLCRQVARDLRTDMPATAPPTSVGAESILLFEGLFLFRRELNDYWDFRILLDISADESLSRALDRDTGILGPADIVKRKYELRYEPAWQIYIREEQPESKANVIVYNRDFSHPVILNRTTAAP